MLTNSNLIITALKHLLYKNLNREMVGFSREFELPTFSIKDIKSYAEATKDDVNFYSENSIIPPLFVSRLIHPFLMNFITDPKLRMNILKMVHGELSIRWLSPIYISDRLSLKMELKEIVDTSAGELLRLSFLIRRESNEVAEAIAGLLIRNPKGEKSKREEVEKETIFTTEIKTDPDQARKYAKASLDNNLIHTSSLFAKLVGLKRPILHGVCVFAMTCNELLKRFASSDKSKLIYMSGRFAYPVYPGETIKLRCYRGEGDNIIDFEVINTFGKQNIRFGKFEFRR
ncbi:MAG: MaoC/PaaZ C-terminal domain-containing protein [Deltaproteobacteria bacterium]|nr:MaoC/PaaZ C-terminal domain-containing protein [Deltaproteobacteria bacterium]